MGKSSQDRIEVAFRFCLGRLKKRLLEPRIKWRRNKTPGTTRCKCGLNEISLQGKEVTKNGTETPVSSPSHIFWWIKNTFSITEIRLGGRKRVGTAPSHYLLSGKQTIKELKRRKLILWKWEVSVRYNIHRDGIPEECVCLGVVRRDPVSHFLMIGVAQSLHNSNKTRKSSKMDNNQNALLVSPFRCLAGVSCSPDQTRAWFAFYQPNLH